MNLHAIQVLEFAPLVEELASLGLSARQWRSERAALLDGTLWFANAADLESIVPLCRFYQLALQGAAAQPNAVWEDLDELWEAIARDGYVATIEELAALASSLRAIDGFLGFTRQAARDLDPRLVPPTLQLQLEALPPMPSVLAEIEACIDATGELKIDRIPELRHARAAIASRQAELRQAAQVYVRDHGDMLSGDFSTIRDGRVVLPVKSGFKGKIEGFVHNASASGSTLFMEPWDIVERNNAVSQAEHEFQAEVQKLLRRLTKAAARDARSAADLEAAADRLDRACARARHARQRGGIFLDAADGLDLRAARHPLLGRKAVPVDIQLPAGKDVLVLSGPNTGGKTVSMKTLGLAVLMRQTAMGVLAAEGSRLPFFAGLVADIGDEQSISNDLSTFSGHLARIRECLAAARPGVLVLLDELGSGTDPDEGAALAVSIGEALLASGCTALLTSHYAALKALGWTSPRAMNASMDYDPGAGRPTYRIVPGQPGASHAIDTARRVGLPVAVVDRAAAIVASRGDPAFDLVQRLAVEHRELVDQRAAVDKRLAELETLHSALARDRQTLEQEKRQVRESQLTEHSRYMAESRSKVEGLLRRLRELEGAASLKEARPETSANVAREARDAMRDLSGELETKQAHEEAARPASQAELVPGKRVRLVDTRAEGMVRAVGKKGVVEVEVGGKRLHLRSDKLEILPDRTGPVASSRVSYELAERSRASLSIDVRGMRLQEAVEALERQLDAALVQNMGYFSVIHGMGEGVLQKGIRDFLAKATGVRSFEYARPEDGGFGKTNVYLG